MVSIQCTTVYPTLLSSFSIVGLWEGGTLMVFYYSVFLRTELCPSDAILIQDSSKECSIPYVLGSRHT